MSAMRLFLLASLLSAVTVACGSSTRPAAHQDFRSIQVHEARVTELLQVSGDESRSCAERQAAAASCVEEADRARMELENVRDDDAHARVTQLAEQCGAARAHSEGRCGPAP